MSAATVELLEWDSAFFGFTVAQIVAEQPDRRDLEAAVEACRGSGVRCAYPGLEQLPALAALVRAAVASFARAGMTSARIVTQAQNIAAQRSYQRAGFRSARSGLWFHRWLD